MQHIIVYFKDRLYRDTINSIEILLRYKDTINSIEILLRYKDIFS